MDDYISTIVLNNFRNYNSKKIDFFKDFNVIIGNNGVGKTNLLEAITVFSNSRGLRNATAEELINIYQKQNLPNNIDYSLLMNLNNGTKILITYGDLKKNIKINGENIKKNSILNNFLKITFLIPQMETFFIDSSSIRRKFLDKTAELVFTNHYDNVKKYEYFIKERMKLITEEKINENWLNIVENKIANLSISIASIRNETLSLLNKIFFDYTKNFPTGILSIDGEIENMMNNKKAEEVKEYITQQLRNNRTIDSQTKKTNLGIHRSDLYVYNREKNIKANLCSNGEQKMLLISLILVRCIFSKQTEAGFPVLLLDEVCSHLDENTKQKLFDELKSLNIQIFLTGLCEEDFKGLSTNNYIKL